MIRNGLARLLEEAARTRRASSAQSLAVGTILKHVGLAKTFESVAAWLRESE